MLQISFSFITCPALLAAYSGQAAFLRKYPEKVAHTFYDSIPRKLINFKQQGELHLIIIISLDKQSIVNFFFFILNNMQIPYIGQHLLWLLVLPL